MLTKNGKVLFTQTTDSSSYKEKDRSFKNTGGTMQGIDSAGYGTGKNLLNLISRMRIDVGSGTAEPTVNDYCLEQIIDSLTVVGSANSGNRAPSYQDNYIHSCSRTYKNNTNDAITVSEIGLVSVLPQKSSSTSYGPFLFAREVITPVTIQPGATYTFSITVG